MLDIQVDGGKQLFPLTDPLPPKPHGDLPDSKALVSQPLLSAGADCASPAPFLKCSVPGWVGF